MNNKSLRTEVARCRAGVAEHLTQVVATTRKLERRLDVAGVWDEATAQIKLDSDPAATHRVQGALLLRKARIHTIAVLRANETRNLHSLAVQMRPVLECAGQVVFLYQTSIIAPDLLMSREKALATLGNRLSADSYQTLVRRTKGQISSKELRMMGIQARAEAAASVGAARPKRQKSWSLNQADKVADLADGHEWYNYLSDHFTHGRLADWKGPSWGGGVISIGRVEDDCAFLGSMSYLVEQLARMNAAAALCPVAGDEGDQWERWVEPMLAQLREVREAAKTLVDAARLALTGEPDGSL